MVVTAAIAIYGAQDVRMEVQLSAPVTSVVRHALQECFGHPKDRAGAARPTPGSFCLNRCAVPRKVLIVLGTRPECLKLASVCRALGQYPDCVPIVLNSGQHQASVERTLAQLEIGCDIRAEQMAGASLYASIKELRAGIRHAAERVAPDVLLAQGDTATAYAAALASRDLGIAFAHVEAGLRTDHPYRPFPEEHFRRRISRIARLHFAPTLSAVRNLHGEGIDPASVVHAGNTIIDLLRNELEQTPAALPLPIATSSRVLTFTLHRRENRGAGIRQACNAVRRLLAAHDDLVVVCPLPAHPATRAQLARELADCPRVQLTESIDYPQFIALLRRSSLIVTDSGGIQEEAPHLGVPLLLLRQNTERVEETALGGATLLDLRREDLCRAASRMLAAPRPIPLPFTDAAPNGDGRAGRRIAHHLLQLLTTGSSSGHRYRYDNHPRGVAV